MRLLFLSMSTSLILLTSCGRSDLENQAAAAEAHAQEESERANALQSQLSSALEERNSAQSLAEQRKAAADSISTFEMTVTLHVSASDGSSVQFPAGGLMGGMSLERGDVSSLTMLETSPGKLASTTTAGEYQISFSYAPERLSDLIGKPISSLEGVESVSAPYERLLKPAGLTLKSSGTADVNVTINRAQVVAAASVPVAVGEDGTVTIQLEDQFQNLFDAYSRAIAQGR